jgi:hypothetical protein
MLGEKGVKWHFSLDNQLLHYAMEEDKLIFLHIGYISNMSVRESSVALFSNPEVISVLNNNFVCIIEDKEDNPESFLLALDMLLMNQDFSHGPVNMFIMPNRKPIIAFSDCDPECFTNLARKIMEAKYEKRDKLNQLADELSKTVLKTGIAVKSDNVSPADPELLNIYLKSWFKSIFETDFISRFKPFTPSPLSLFTVIEFLRSFPDMKISERVEDLLDHFQFSPLFDVIDGGFFRQAADYTCLKPLYEKTLEENSQFMALYSLAYDYYRKESYKETALLTSEYILNALGNGKGGFYNSSTLMCGTDESFYYHFSLNELKIMFPERYKEIAEVLGIDSQTDLRKKQLPVRGPETYELLSTDELKMLRSRRKEHRSYFRDERCITSSNAMAVKSFTLASQYLNEPSLYKIAVKNFEFIIYNNINREDGRPYRYTCKSEGYLTGYLSDYAHLIEASIEIYEAGGEEEYYYVAKRYFEYVKERFYKPSNGMFSKSEKGSGSHTVPFKRESNIDFVRPSANSVMAGNLLRLYQITLDNNYLSMAEQQLKNVAPNLMDSGPMLSNWAHKILAYINMRFSSE